MRVRTAFLFLVVLLIAALAFLNWGVLSSSSGVSLGFTTVSAPLGLIMLGLTAVLAVFFPDLCHLHAKRSVDGYAPSVARAGNAA